MQMAVGEVHRPTIAHEEPLSFLSDIGASRTRTRAHLAQRKSILATGADRGLIVTLLNEALASETLEGLERDLSAILQLLRGTE